MSDAEENPIASGLIALVAVAVVVGLLGGIAMIMGTRLVGFGGDGGGNGSAGGGASLYMPDPVPTQSESGPLITLAPTEEPDSEASPTETIPTALPTTEEPAELSLSVSPSHVVPGEPLMLSGIYSGGEGSVLDIFYNVNGAGWEEFPLDTNVSGSIFQVYVETWKTGSVQWKVQDAANQVESSPVTVTIG